MCDDIGRVCEYTARLSRNVLRFACFSAAVFFKLQNITNSFNILLFLLEDIL